MVERSSEERFLRWAFVFFFLSQLVRVVLRAFGLVMKRTETREEEEGCVPFCACEVSEAGVCERGKEQVFGRFAFALHATYQ